MKEKIRKIKESISNAPHKKKAIIAIIVALCLVGGAAGGYVYMTNTDFGKADVASQSDDKELTAEEKEKAAEKKLEKAKESGDKEAVKEAEKEVEKAKEKVKASNSNSSSNKPSNSGSSSTNKPSKPSSGNSGSSGSGGSTTTQPSKPAHQHNWQPIYKEYTTQIIDPNNPSYIKCGANLGRNGENWMDHADATGHEHGTTRVYNYISHVEKQLVGYKCSCGATK